VLVKRGDLESRHHSSNSSTAVKRQVGGGLQKEIHPLKENRFPQTTTTDELNIIPKRTSTLSKSTAPASTAVAEGATNADCSMSIMGISGNSKTSGSVSSRRKSVTSALRVVRDDCPATQQLQLQASSCVGEPLVSTSHAPYRPGAATSSLSLSARRVSNGDGLPPPLQSSRDIQDNCNNDSIDINTNSVEATDNAVSSIRASRNGRQGRARRVSMSSLPGEVPESGGGSGGDSVQLQSRQWLLSDFEVGKKLGKGKYGNVYKATDKASKVVVALKVLFKSEIMHGGDSALLQTKREVEIHSRVHHPAILRMLGYFDDDAHIYLVLQFGFKGELFRLLQRLPYKRLPEHIAAFYIYEIGNAVQYLHDRHVYHRDIKPENILLAGDFRPLLADFGWSVHAPTPYDKRGTLCGTPDYISPEMVEGKPYDHTADVWSLGVMLYEFLVGYAPFTGKTDMETYDNILAASPIFPPSSTVYIPKEAKDLILSCLAKKPSDRFKLVNLSSHPFVARHLREMDVDNIDAEMFTQISM
jgi:hypothetical protein